MLQDVRQSMLNAVVFISSTHTCYIDRVSTRAWSRTRLLSRAHESTQGRVH